MAKGSTAIANEERGEVSITLDGTQMVMRPSYEAIVGFEQETGKGLLDLSRDALTGRMGLGELSQVAAACIRAWGREQQTSNASVNTQRVAELILESETGFHGVLQEVSGMLALAVTGGYTAKGEVKPTTKTKTDGALVAG